MPSLQQLEECLPSVRELDDKLPTAGTLFKALEDGKLEGICDDESNVDDD